MQGGCSFEAHTRRQATLRCTRQELIASPSRRDVNQASTPCSQNLSGAMLAGRDCGLPFSSFFLFLNEPALTLAKKGVTRKTKDGRVVRQPGWDAQVSCLRTSLRGKLILVFLCMRFQQEKFLALAKCIIRMVHHLSS